MTHPTYALEASDIRKVYEGGREMVAVDCITLQVAEGELFGILGPNGAGKTTTIQLCTTRARLTAGTVHIAGVDVSKEPARARLSMGVVTQFNTLDRSLTVEENLYFHCLYFGFFHARAKQRTQEVLQQFRLSERAKSYPHQLSGGMVQRVQIARALIHGPRVLFLDEPSAGLDPQTRLAMWETIRTMRADGVTIILTTHSMHEADALCDRVAILDHGKILACDSPARLKKTLSAEGLFEIAVSGPTPEFEERLNQLDGVQEVHRMSTGFRVLASERAGLLPRIVAAASGIDIRDITVTEPNLETVFLKLTGRALRD